MGCESSPISELELQHLLLERAGMVAQYVTRRIPRRCRANVTPDDVLQDVWVSAFQCIRGFKYEGPGSFDRWLLAIAGRRLADTLRTANTLKRGGADITLRDSASRRQSYSDLFGLLAAPDKTPSQEMSAEEVARVVQIALGGLPEARRRVVYLRHIEGRTRQEIAQELQKSDSAISSLLYQGLRELRGLLGQATRFFSDERPAEEVSSMVETAG